MEDRLALSLPEAASALGLNIKTLRALITSGRLPATNVAQGTERKHYLVSVAAIREFLQGR